MKKASCVLIIVLLLLLEISAKAEWVSIVELRQQVDEMGRWIQNYTDTYCQCADRRIYESCQTEGQAAGCSQGDFMEGCAVSG